MEDTDKNGVVLKFGQKVQVQSGKIGVYESRGCVFLGNGTYVVVADLKTLVVLKDDYAL